MNDLFDRFTHTADYLVRHSMEIESGALVQLLNVVEGIFE